MELKEHQKEIIVCSLTLLTHSFHEELLELDKKVKGSLPTDGRNFKEFAMILVQLKSVHELILLFSGDLDTDEYILQLRQDSIKAIDLIDEQIEVLKEAVPNHK